jgi:SEC-C motif-containing protein
MRSRYTAYATGNVDYVLNTHDPKTVSEIDRSGIEHWSKKSEWFGLEVLETEKGSASDEEGTVEFVARYKINGATVNHRERAIFRKDDGRWVFVDGEEIAGPPVVREGPRIGRNDPCSCGSGKKYKKCCGKPGAAV